MPHTVLRCLAYFLVALFALPAAARPASKRIAPEVVHLDEEGADAENGAARQAAPPPSDEDEEQEEEDKDKDKGDANSAGVECSPAISEVETRRPIPFSCAVTKPSVHAVELRYKAPGRRKWTKLKLKKTGAEFTGEIPCVALSKRGVLKLSVVGFDAKHKSVARISGVEVKVVEVSNQPPPALPGREPPMRCYAPSDCPQELRGSAACPGTKATAGLRSWGASCGRTSECQSGLACISGSCEKPPTCDTSAECGGGECINGKCSYPDPGDAGTQLGPPKLNWFGLHFAADFAVTRNATGVCGSEGADAEDYTCFDGSNRYTGVPNRYYAGKVPGGIGLSTMRVLGSYDRWFGRLLAGVRLGFAFNGAPKGFLPVHAELRFAFSVRADPLRKRFRPYIGLAGGLGQVDTHGRTLIADCIDNVSSCRETNVLQMSDVAARHLDAYRSGSKVFFGPTIGALYALTNESALQLNFNLMLPNFTVQPSLGYVMGI